MAANLAVMANQAGRNTDSTYAAHPRRAAKSDPSRNGTIGLKNPDGVSVRGGGEVAKRERDTRSKATEKEVRELLDQVKPLNSMGSPQRGCPQGLCQNLPWSLRQRID